MVIIIGVMIQEAKRSSILCETRWRNLLLSETSSGNLQPKRSYLSISVSYARSISGICVTYILVRGERYLTGEDLVKGNGH